jgi:hypothetical protein
MCRSSGVDRAHGWGALTIPARITASDQLGLLLVMQAQRNRNDSEL